MNQFGTNMQQPMANQFMTGMGGPIGGPMGMGQMGGMN